MVRRPREYSQAKNYLVEANFQEYKGIPVSIESKKPKKYDKQALVEAVHTPEIEDYCLLDKLGTNPIQRAVRNSILNS